MIKYKKLQTELKLSIYIIPCQKALKIFGKIKGRILVFNSQFSKKAIDLLKFIQSTVKYGLKSADTSAFKTPTITLMSFASNIWMPAPLFFGCGSIIPT